MKEEMKHMQAVEMMEVEREESAEVEWGWCSDGGSWFQRHGEAYWKEQSVIRRDDDDVGGRATVTSEEKQVFTINICCFIAKIYFQISIFICTGLVRRPNQHHHAKFCQNRTYHYGRILQFFSYKMAASVIVDFQNLKFLVASRVRKASAHHCTKFIKISQTVADIAFKVFQNGGRPSFWISGANFGMIHKEYLVVFIAVQNLVGIASVILIIQKLNILHVWLENVPF